MKRHSIFYEKRAVTEMVAYVAMVIVAFSISILIYSYLQVQAPKDRPECPEGVSLGVQDVTCTLLPNKICNGISQGGTGKMDITLVNNGKRSISGAFIRFGLPGSKVKESINKDTPFFKPLTDIGQELLPGKTLTQNYTLALGDQVSIGEQSLEIEPVFGEPNNLALCEDSVVTRRVNCELPGLRNVPPQIPGLYTLQSPKEYGRTVINITPDSSYAEGIDRLEVTLCRFSGGTCVPESASPRNTSCPSTNGGYGLEWGGLQGGNYEMRSVIVLHDGTRVPVTRGPSGPTTYSFSIASCLGRCESDDNGIRIRKNDGTIICSEPNVCSGNQWRKWYCNDNCYAGNSGLDSQMYELVIFGCTSCSSSTTCGGSLTFVVPGPFYRGCNG